MTLQIISKSKCLTGRVMVGLDESGEKKIDVKRRQSQFGMDSFPVPR